MNLTILASLLTLLSLTSALPRGYIRDPKLTSSDRKYWQTCTHMHGQEVRINLSKWYQIDIFGIFDCARPATSTCKFYLINWTLKMNATPSFGVSMISEVPSNPQLTLGLEPTSSHYRKIEIHVKMRIGKYESFFLSRISRVHYGIIDWFTIFDDFGFENLEFQNAFQLNFLSFWHSLVLCISQV